VGVGNEDQGFREEEDVVPPDKRLGSDIAHEHNEEIERTHYKD
jgi:hypothetical protein